MRVNEHRRRSVIKQIPSKLCHATSNSTQKPCQRWAMVGANVCQKHGGLAPQVRRKAEERITLAEALASGTKRQPWEVLDDTLHVVDVLMQQAVQAITVDNLTGMKAVQRLVEAVERASRMAKTNLDAGNDARRVQLAEGQAGQLHRVFSRVLNGLELTDTQRALVPALLEREIKAVTAVEGRVVEGGKQAA